MVLKLTLEYDGSNYSGWQLQPRHDSIQGRIEAALETIFETADLGSPRGGGIRGVVRGVAGAISEIEKKRPIGGGRALLGDELDGTRGRR